MNNKTYMVLRVLKNPRGSGAIYKEFDTWVSAEEYFQYCKQNYKEENFAIYHLVKLEDTTECTDNVIFHHPV